jgi:hypothetical protein
MYAGVAVTDEDVPIPLTAGFVCMPLSEEFPLPDGVSPGTTSPLRPDVLLGLSYERSRAFQPPKYEYSPYFYDVDHMPSGAVATSGVYRPIEDDYLGKHTKFGYPTLYGGNTDWVGHEADQLSCSWFRMFGRYLECTILEDNAPSFGGSRPSVFFRGATIVDVGTVINDSEIPVAAQEFVLGAGMKYCTNAEGVAAGLYIFVVLAKQLGYADPEDDVAIRFVRWRVRSDEVLGYEVTDGVVMDEWDGTDIVDPEEEASPGSLPVIDLRGTVLAFNASCTTARMACFRVNYKPLAKLQFDFTATNVSVSYELIDEPAEGEEYVVRPVGVMDYHPIAYPYYNEGATPSNPSYSSSTESEATLGWDYVGDNLVTVKLRITKENETDSTLDQTLVDVGNGHDYTKSSWSFQSERTRAFLIMEGAVEMELELEDYTTTVEATIEQNVTWRVYQSADPTDTFIRDGTNDTSTVTTKTLMRRQVARIDARIGLVVFVKIDGSETDSTTVHAEGSYETRNYLMGPMNVHNNNIVTTTIQQDNRLYTAKWIVRHGDQEYVIYEDESEYSNTDEVVVESDDDDPYWFPLFYEDPPFFILGPSGEEIYPTQTTPTLEFPSAPIPEITSSLNAPHPFQSSTNATYCFRANECVMYIGPNPTAYFETASRPNLYSSYVIEHPEFDNVKHFMGMAIHLFKAGIMVSMPVGLQEPKWAHFLSIDKSATTLTFIEGEEVDNSFYPIWTLYDKDKPGNL